MQQGSTEPELQQGTYGGYPSSLTEYNVAARAGESEACLKPGARLARLLSNRSDTLMLLSATPRWLGCSLCILMSLLDPTAISDPDNYNGPAAKAWCSVASKRHQRPGSVRLSRTSPLCLRQPTALMKSCLSRLVGSALHPRWPTQTWAQSGVATWACKGLVLKARCGARVHRRRIELLQENPAPRLKSSVVDALQRAGRDAQSDG